MNANGETALGLNVKNLILRLLLGGLCDFGCDGNVLVLSSLVQQSISGDFSQYQIDFVAWELQQLLTSRCFVFKKYWAGIRPSLAQIKLSR